MEPLTTDVAVEEDDCINSSQQQQQQQQQQVEHKLVMHRRIAWLCAFIFFLSFKPSEPYLSQYLICDYNSAADFCDGFSDEKQCDKQQNQPCEWSSSRSECRAASCSSLSHSKCGDRDYSYCYDNSHSNCRPVDCYKHFSDWQVNDDIYPWSTYAYFPLLLLLGPFAELFSYRAAILLGISGRVATRFLLLYGTSLPQMQLMQVTYACGTAAEDVFTAYVFYVLSGEYYQLGTGSVQAAALVGNLLAGVLADLLVVLLQVPLTSLMWISAASVLVGFCIGVYFLATTNSSSSSSSNNSSSSSTSINNIDTRRRSGDSAVNGSSIAAALGARKLALFRRQLRLLLRALRRSKALLSLLCYWLLGNAVYATVFDYEIAVYEQLTGSNRWNGSVLSVILLCGAAGAIAPSLLHANENDSNAAVVDDITAPAAATDSSSTDGAAELAAVCESPLAGSDSDVPLTDHCNEPSTPAPAVEGTTAISSSSREKVLIVSDLTVAARVITAGVPAALLLLLAISSWQIVATVAFLALFFAAWQYINVTTLTRLALHLKREQLQEQQQQQLQQSVSSTADVQNAMHGDVCNESYRLEGTGSAATEGSTKVSEVEEVVDPPYSVAFVAVIALNVLAQVVLQAVAFSGLQLPIRDAFWIFAVVFCVATAGYCCITASWFGYRRLRAAALPLKLPLHSQSTAATTALDSATTVSAAD